MKIKKSVKKSALKRINANKTNKKMHKKVTNNRVKHKKIKKVDSRLKKGNRKGNVKKEFKKRRIVTGSGVAKSGVARENVNVEIDNSSSIILKQRKRINLNERVSSGIQNFDSMIGKGFQKNSTNLILGGVGSGKTIFAMQFLVDGMKKGERCLYLSFDEGKDSFYSNMKGLGWDLYDYEKKGKFFFLEYSPQKIKTMLDEGGGIIENLVLSKKITRIAMDSITSFLFLFSDEIEEREATLSLINLLKRWDCTTILTYEGNPSRENKTVLKTSSRILELESDSIVLLYFLRNKNERGRYLEILKIKGVKHPTKIFPFSIEKGGVKVGKSPYKGEIELE